MHRLQSLPAEAVAKAAIETLNGVQQNGPQEQILGLASALQSMCRATGIDVREVFYIVGRMERDCRFRNVNTLDAVQRYCDEEIKKKLFR